MSTRPQLALVLCARNEERFLPAFLAYHRALGVDRAYVYLDRCTDRSRDHLARHDWVEVIERNQPDGTTQLSLHQMACANDALVRARAQEIPWLMMLDADEFAWGGDPLPRPCPAWRRWLGLPAATLAARGHLSRLIDGAAADTEMILLRTAEVVVEAGREDLPFWTQHHFQTEVALHRPVLHPGTGEMRTLNRWLGHRLGKSIVRTACDVQAFDSHRWTRRQDRDIPDDLPLRTEQHGWILHYVVTGPEHWRQKYLNLAYEPAHWLRGQPVDFPKQAWKEAAMRMDEAEARDYFSTWVAVPPRLVRAARRRGSLRRVSVVEDILKQTKFC